MTTVLAGGDSFVWGSELSDCRHGGPLGYSRKTFPALLAQEHDYICAAYPGIGNQEIAQRILTVVHSTPVDLVIVSWTWPTRDNQIDSDDVIKNLRWTLEYYKIPYLFICADNCVITNKIRYSNWFMFPSGKGPDQTESPRGFYQWAVENKYDCGKENHPLEQAHQDAANLMKEQFNELVKKSLEST
jgi:hypothetical protein